MVRKSFSNWYDTHGDDFNAQRRARYKEDKEYRDRVQAYTRRYRKNNPPIKRDADGGFRTKINGRMRKGYRMAAASKLLKLSAHTIRYLETHGWVPIPDLKKGQRYFRIYTKKQLTLIQAAYQTREMIKAGTLSRQSGEDTKQRIRKEWYA